MPPRDLEMHPTETDLYLTSASIKVELDTFGVGHGLEGLSGSLDASALTLGGFAVQPGTDGRSYVASRGAGGSYRIEFSEDPPSESAWVAWIDGAAGSKPAGSSAPTPGGKGGSKGPPSGGTAPSSSSGSSRFGLIALAVLFGLVLAASSGKGD